MQPKLAHFLPQVHWELVGAVKLGQSQGEVFLGRDMGHERDYSEGMAAVVEKPIKPERLRMAMNAALSETEAQAGSADGDRSAA